jgi:PAS domain S-box-containing protein
MDDYSIPDLLKKIKELENRIEESDQLIEAIRAGEVDAFAINNQIDSEIYTLQSGDYAYRILIEEFGEGAINVTEEGIIVYSNSYFFELLNTTYDKVIGASIYDFIHKSSKEDFKKLFHKSFTKKSRGEILLVSNSEIPVYISLTSLQPKLPTVGIIITDLSEKKKNENMILDYQRDLENKNKELVQSNMELASFAYIASHDLQEPLRKIQTFATRIMEKEKENLTETGKDHFLRMQMAAKRMQTLIEDLLSYSRTNTLDRNFICTNLQPMVKDVIEDLREEIQQKKATINIGDMCEANIIPFQFRQLINNLVSNSMKFSKPGEPVEINISSKIVRGDKSIDKKLSPEKNYCHITISDTGIGFEQQYSEKIFELFQRLHNKADYKGTGIGLAIVKKIVENHSGVIKVKSEIGKGAIFEMWIPAD